MVVLVYGLVAAIVTGWTMGSAYSCEEIAECSTGSLYGIYDLHQETADTVLVSGSHGLVRCELTGGQGQLVQGPPSNLRVQSALVTQDGTLWAVAYHAWDKQNHLYRQNTTGTWHKEFVDDNFNPSDLDIDSNGHLVLLNSPYRNVYFIQPTPEIAIVSILNLTAAATWRNLTRLAVLPSGSVAITDMSNSCAHLVSRDGTLESTMGTCGSPALPGDSVLGQLIRPTGITTDNEGNILISDYLQERISVFNSTGSPVTTRLCKGWYPPVRNPFAVLVTSGGLLVIGGLRDGNVKVFKYEK